MTLAIVINHAPHREDRKACLARMLAELGGRDRPVDGLPLFLNDDPRLKPAGPTKVEWTKRQWRWALDSGADHCLFMSDDLNLAPGFLSILRAMIEAKPTAILGLLSSHPRAVRLALAGYRWYRTNSWIVGPAYVFPRAHLAELFAWFCSLPDGDGPGQIANLNDDSSANLWVSSRGPHETWHPLPTIIEHRDDIATTWVTGDKYSRERVSWREIRRTEGDAPHRWISERHEWALFKMSDPAYWAGAAEMLPVAPEEDDWSWRR